MRKICLEQKAELAVQGDCAARKRQSETEPDVDLTQMGTKKSDKACMKSIETANVKDWSCSRRFSGQIRLKEKISFT